MYIGETDNFFNRIKQHIVDADKEWWNHFIVFLANDNLNKAHVRHLEKHFWEVATHSPQIEIMNSSPPGGANLSEEDKADLEIFKENILYVLEALNLGYFQTDEAKKRNDGKNHIYVTTALASREDSKAFMEKIDEAYILKTGSYVCLKAKDSFQSSHLSYYQKWKELIDSPNVKKTDQEVGVLQRDLEFTSPSVCGALVKARATNGLTAWKNKTSGKTLKDELGE